MKYSRVLILTVCVLTLMTSGCEFFGEKKSAVEAGKEQTTPTPVPTATPAPTATPLPTATPVPTSTPAPRMIGTKTSQSKFAFITNNTNTPLREVYLRVSDTDDWGKNMVPNESTIKASEKVQMFYDTPQSDDTRYDMKIVDKSGNSYAIYYIDLTDMESGALRLQDGSAYLTYMSLSGRKEVSTQNSEQLASDYYSQVETTETTNDNTDDTYYDSTIGDPDYGYYDDNGEWVNYTNDYDNSVIDTTGGDDGGSYYGEDEDYDDHIGNSDYGYYDDNGEWVYY